MKIKQWKQKLANWFLRDVTILHLDVNGVTQPGCRIVGNGWYVEVAGEPLPQPSVPISEPYVPRYNTRTELQHREIRKRIQQDPKTCRHLKGGGITNGVKDYNVLTHTFPNDRTRIRCANCSRVWWNTDADWQDAVKMVQQSTNTPSSSEVNLATDPRTRHLVRFQDSLK
jgi:hypothetical protein